MLHLSEETKRLLETAENAVDPGTEEDFRRQWENFLYHRAPVCEPFRAVRRKPYTEPYAYRNININDALKDYETMLVSQTEGALRALQSQSGIPCVRANYGTGILSSLFGAEVFVMPREMNTLPTTRPVGADAVKAILDRGMPDLCTGFGRQVFEMGEYFLEAFAPYPKLSEYVPVYHPDTQGPLDICELLIGCDIFYLMYDEPELLTALLQLVTDTYCAFLDRWYGLFPKTREAEYNVHWGNLMHRGRIVLRDDSAMNVSPEFYRTFAYPYDAALLKRFGGGIVHFCGRGDHYIDILTEAEGLYGINMSQPEYNDMEKIYRCTVDRGIPILAFSRSRAEQDKSRPGGFRGNLSI